MPFPLFVLTSSAIAVATMAATLLLSHSRWPGLSAIAAVFGATPLLLFHIPGGSDFLADDAFITFRYSDHLAEGLGPNWNSEGWVEGYTNFLWMALLAGVAKVGVDVVDASRVLGFFAILATFVFVYAIWRLWSHDEKDSGIDSPVLLAVVLLGLAWPSPMACPSGASPVWRHRSSWLLLPVGPISTSASGAARDCPGRPWHWPLLR